MKKYFTIEEEQEFGKVTSDALKENNKDMFLNIFPTEEELYLLLSAVGKGDKLKLFLEKREQSSKENVDTLFLFINQNISTIETCNFLGTLTKNEDKQGNITRIAQLYAFYETPTLVFRILFRHIYCMQRLMWTGEEIRITILDDEDSKEVKEHFSKG